MEFRLFIPDTPRRAFQAARYWLGIRKSPVRVYGIADFRAEHMKVIKLSAELRALRAKNSAQREKIKDLSRELSKMKRE